MPGQPAAARYRDCGDCHVGEPAHCRSSIRSAQRCRSSWAAWIRCRAHRSVFRTESDPQAGKRERLRFPESYRQENGWDLLVEHDGPVGGHLLRFTSSLDHLVAGFRLRVRPLADRLRAADFDGGPDLHRRRLRLGSGDQDDVQRQSRASTGIGMSLTLSIYPGVVPLEHDAGRLPDRGAAHADIDPAQARLRADSAAEQPAHRDRHCDRRSEHSRRQRDPHRERRRGVRRVVPRDFGSRTLSTAAAFGRNSRRGKKSGLARSRLPIRARFRCGFRSRIRANYDGGEAVKFGLTQHFEISRRENKIFGVSVCNGSKQRRLHWRSTRAVSLPWLPGFGRGRGCRT